MVEAHALLTVAQMGRSDAQTVARGTSGMVLMEAAGGAVARAIMQRWALRSVLVLCGPGNNGGDGWVAARHLQDAGWPVTLASLVPPQDLHGDALQASQAWAGPVQVVSDLTVLREMVASSALVIDALFGAGLSRAPDGMVAQVLTMVREAGVPVVAVDVPSGVWGDTGQADGALACALTVTFFRLKPAHLLMPARALCGEVMLADIGTHKDVLADGALNTWENVPALWLGAWPSHGMQGHKYDRGHAVVWGGARMTGAARLAARACARVGAGLTTVCVPESAWGVYATALDSIMVHSVASTNDDGGEGLASGLATLLQDVRHRAVLVGPGAASGLGLDGVRHLSEAALRSGRQVVLDADAISAWQGDLPTLQREIAALGARGVVLTPHDGEFARLFGSSIDAADRLMRARQAARASGAVVLLKGADTVVAAPDGRACINRHASPHLATAGSGDVLSGLIVGLLAQGMPAWEAASAAVWMHGDAALHFGPGLIADDLPEAIAGVRRRLAQA